MKQSYLKNINKFIVNHPYIFVVLIVLLLIILFRYLYIPTLRYKNIYLKELFNNDEVNSIAECFNKEIDNEKLECYKRKQDFIFNKVKSKLGVDYLRASHARWSNSSNNDARSYHRDVKPLLFKFNNDYPDIYTMVIFLNDTEHYQGGELLHVKKGDCLLFNAFNIHKRGNDIVKENENRMVLQYFHVFLNKDEYNKFEKKHSYAEHIDATNILKYVNKIVDLRTELEYFNLFSYTGINYDKDSEYLTFILNDKIMGEADGVKYYKAL
jgi:hypothetical protein